ncbi:GH116 family glycosyl-hydrolase [Fulvivirgaceae bacterium BMA10]|uniref:GH116 family glycosyl-hydrolase n=1 Tax=Splendidivirga corallicola TaxID=3051826 RepID=A0ABT8KIY1_9BACT|nr:GH116 family glycosyl-hydrolase [Fulvivirgaceae bacterium BMA10]
MNKLTLKISIVFVLLHLVCTVKAQKWNSTWPVLKTYEGKHLAEVAMPLGGIGTGTVSIGGKGDLRDWEIMNRGAIGYLPAFKLVAPTIANGPFFALYYKKGNDNAKIKVLEGPIDIKDYYGDWGANAVNSGFPRFEKATFAAAYPMAQINFEHRDVPIDIRLEAFNPLVVGDADRSGIPVAILRYVMTNNTDESVETSLVGMVPNYIGTDGWSGEPNGNYNEYRENGKLKGLYMYSEGVDKKDINWGTMALTTLSDGEASYRTSWAKLGWNWTFREFWDDFIADGKITDHPERSSSENAKETEFIGDNLGNSTTKIKTPPATLAVKQTLQPGESKTVTYMLTWHFPNRTAWNNMLHHHGTAIVGNYYATQYENAWEVAEKTAANFEMLEKETINFVSALANSDIPDVLKEAGLFNLNNLRSQTVFRTADGLPFGWEGTGSIFGTKIGAEKASGWGHGTCFHVWNYESTIPFLFGDLSTKFREVEFMHATNEQGAQSHRVNLPISNAKGFRHWAADGQMGTLIKMYRDWQLSGDDDKLRSMWPNIKKAMSFAWTGIWDTNKDGVMEGSQHNTMDINYVGPNPQMAGWYLGALKASAEMASYLGDKKFEKECNDLYKRGRKWIDTNIFNGDYYEHHIPEEASKVAQLGKGCLVDQLVGQYLAHTTGLGYVLDQDNVRSTLKSIMKYNYVDNFNEHFNTFRSFAIGDEAGLVMASYPKEGTLLDFPFPYYTELMTGFEYSTAAHMIYEGQVENGLKIFSDIRNRYDGYKRNPFNEGEYGHRYARAMAAWAGILAYTGFQYSAVNQTMKFNSNEGQYFWSNGYQYGTVKLENQSDNIKVTLSSHNADIMLKSFTLNGYGILKFKKAKTFEKGKEVSFIISHNDNEAGFLTDPKIK